MTTSAASLDELLTTADVAAILRLSPRTIRNARSTGKAGYPAWIKVGGVVRYQRSAVAEYLAAQEQQAAAPRRSAGKPRRA